MASKRTLNAKNLEALGAPTLAALLIELSSGQAVMQRRLRLALAAADGAAVAAQEVRKRLAAIARSTTFVDARKRKALLADLQAQHQAISGPIAAADPAQAWQLLLRYLELADGVLERSSDGTGALAGAFAEALQDLAPLAVAAGLKPEALVEPVIELIAANGYGQFDDLIPAVAPALGEPGLAFLQHFYEQNGGPDATLVLLQIAELRGDVDAYLAQFSPRQLAQPLVAADVAPLLLEAGRAEQALALLDGAAANVGDWQLLDWGDARIAVLEALRRPAAALGPVCPLPVDPPSAGLSAATRRLQRCRSRGAGPADRGPASEAAACAGVSGAVAGAAAGGTPGARATRVLGRRRV